MLYNSGFVKAQVPVKDTIYYLIDTARIPINDRLIEIKTEGPIRYFAFKCRCFSNNKYPAFLYNTIKQKGLFLSEKEVNALNFISVSSLLDMIKKSGKTELRDHVLYFIERSAEHSFLKYKVILYTGLNDVTNIDQINIPKGR